MRSQRDIHFRSWIVNMTDCPFDKYEEITGCVRTFFPSLLRFSKMTGNYPRSACYVFTDKVDERAQYFQSHGYDVAVIENYALGRDGANIARIVSLCDGKNVAFREASYL